MEVVKLRGDLKQQQMMQMMWGNLEGTKHDIKSVMVFDVSVM